MIPWEGPEEPDETEYCCRCQEEMPSSIMDWWLTADGHYCSQECAAGSNG